MVQKKGKNTEDLTERKSFNPNYISSCAFENWSDELVNGYVEALATGKSVKGGPDVNQLRIYADEYVPPENVLQENSRLEVEPPEHSEGVQPEHSEQIEAESPDVEAGIVEETPEEKTEPAIDSGREIDWRSMNRMAVVVRDSILSHPFELQFKSATLSGDKKKKDAKKPKSQEPQIEYSDEKVRLNEELLLEYKEESKRLLGEYSKPIQFMKKENFACFYSVLSVIYHHHQIIHAKGLGNYLWELIYPKNENIPYLPRKNDTYFVKLYYRGDYRMVAVNDKFPFNNNQCLYPQTIQYEFWPAILAKAVVALSSGRERMALQDPIWILQALCGPFISSPTKTNISLVNSVTVVQKSLEQMSLQEKEVSENLNQYASQAFSLEQLKQELGVDATLEEKELDISNGPFTFLCATSFSVSDLSAENRELMESVGLLPSHLYFLNRVSSFKGEFAFHVYGYQVNWKGELNYDDANVWDADFESEIGFERQDKQMTPFTNDFWIPMSQFKKFFTNIHVMADADKFTQRKHLFGENLPESFCFYSDTDNELNVLISAISKEESVPIDNDPKAKKDKKGKKDKEPVIDQDLEPIDYSQEITFSFDYFSEKQGWLPMKDYSIDLMYDKLVSLPIASKELYRISFYPHVSLNVLKQILCQIYSKEPISIGTEDELKEKFFAWQISEYNPVEFTIEDGNKWQVLFVKQVSVSEQTELRASLDLELNSTASVGQEIESGDENSNSSIPLTNPYSFVTFTLVNNETLECYSSTSKGKLLPVTLTVPESSEDDVKGKKKPSLSTYSLVAICKPDNQVSGKYSLKIENGKGVESIQSIPSLYTCKVSGYYIPNKQNELFRYLIWSGDSSIGAIHLEIDQPVETVVTVADETNKVLYQRTISVHQPNTMLSISIPTIVLSPSLKNEAHYVYVYATIHPYHAEKMRQESLKGASDRYVDYLKNTEPQPEEDQSKKGKAKSKPKAKGKKGQQDGRPIRIPSKQSEPQTMITIPELAPPFEYAPESEVSKEFLRYQMIYTFTSPNIIVEKVDERLELIKKLTEEWESSSPGRIDESQQTREKLLMERVRRYHKGETEIQVSMPAWKEFNVPNWFNQARYLPLEHNVMQTDSVKILLTEEMIQKRKEQLENQQKSALDHYNAMKDIRANWKSDLEERDERMKEILKEMDRQIGEEAKKRIEFHVGVNEERARLEAERIQKEKELAAAAKKGKKK